MGGNSSSLLGGRNDGLEENNGDPLNPEGIGLLGGGNEDGQVGVREEEGGGSSRLNSRKKRNRLSALGNTSFSKGNCEKRKRNDELKRRKRRRKRRRMTRYYSKHRLNSNEEESNNDQVHHRHHRELEEVEKEEDSSCSCSSCISSSSSTTTDEDDEFNLYVPKRRKLGTTSSYIYQTLFKEGHDSDVTVRALDKEWKLHRLYLCQSSYFSSMFNGSWKESSMDKITITVADPTINLSALDTALGSLYRDEIEIVSADVVGILAAATLLQLEGLIQQCTNIMEETTNVETVVVYYDASSRYGVVKVQKSCLTWLRTNLLNHLPEYPARLREISVNLMSNLINSPDLFVMQTEFSVYVLLRLWLYLILHPEWQGAPQDAVIMSHRYFQERVQSTREYFLESNEGKYYDKAFKALRYNHLINHHMDMEMLLTDRIIPKEWMYPTFLNQWQLLLRSDQGIDKGPQSMSDEDFNKLCLRCGRTLNVEGQPHMWRWTGFNMGLDLIVNFDKDVLTLKRNMTIGSGGSGASEHEALLANHKKRHVMYRVTVVSLNQQKQIIYKESSGIKSVCMNRNTQHQLLKIDSMLATFPLLLSFNFAVTTPMS